MGCEVSAALHVVRVESNLKGGCSEELGLKTLIIGHGAPIGPESLPANIEYLEAAKAAYASSAKSEDFVAAVSAALPERSPEMWLNWSSQMLYGHVAP